MSERALARVFGTVIKHYPVALRLPGGIIRVMIAIKHGSFA